MTLQEYAGEPMTPESARLCVTADPDDMTAAQVRMLAAELLNAADELDALSDRRAG